MSEAAQRARDAKTSMYRALIVDAAEPLFAERGYEGTKIQDIASASGLSLGTLYSVFGGKAGVYDALQDERLGELFLLAGETMSSRESAVSRLIQANRVFIRWLTEHPDFLRIHLNESNAWASNPRQVGTDLTDAWHRGIDLIAAVFGEAMREGDVYDTDPVIAARLLVAMQQVFMSAWVESGMKDDPDALIDQIEQQLVRALFRSQS
jgi:AcrR family transcriptional regulator